MYVPLELVPPETSLVNGLIDVFGPEWGPKVYSLIVEELPYHPNFEEAGRGHKGVVYGLGDAGVVKITSDETEIEAMYRIMKKPSDRLVRVNDVFVVCSPVSLSPRTYKPIARPAAVGVIVREWVGQTFEDFDLQWENHALGMAVTNALDYLRRREGKGTDLELLSEAMEMMQEELRDQKERFPLLGEISKAMGDLRARGIYGIDFHPRNIAITDAGVPVIFDVGVVRFKKPSKVRTINCPKQTEIS